MVRNKKLKKGDVIQVDWGDAWGSSGWERITDPLCKDFGVTNVGVFCHQNKNGLLMAIGLDEQGKGHNVAYVPHGMVKKIKIIVRKTKIRTSY